MENNIFNSFNSESFVSPCVYKLIIYINVFSCIDAALHKNDRVGAHVIVFSLFLNFRKAFDCVNTRFCY